MSDTTWISYLDAARTLDVSPGTIAKLVRDGHLEHRDAPRHLPSIGRDSATQLARRRHAEQLRVEQARQAKAARNQPPDDGQVWLSVSATAALLRVTPTRVTQMLRTEQLPATKKGHRWWVLRLHAEMAAAARADSLRRATR